MKMDHLVFLDDNWNEIEELISGKKSMIIQGFDELKTPQWTVAEGDVIYLAYNSYKDEIKARGVADTVVLSPPLTREESFEIIIRNQTRLMLPDDQFYKWAGKRYLILVGIKDIETFESEKPENG